MLLFSIAADGSNRTAILNNSTHKMSIKYRHRRAIVRKTVIANKILFVYSLQLYVYGAFVMWRLFKM